MVMVIKVRPWKALSKVMIAGRPVAQRAILTAFSTASAPLLKKMAFLGKSPGASLTMRSANSTYGSYIITLKQVCVNLAACSAMARVTSGRACPIFIAPMPPDWENHSKQAVATLILPYSSTRGEKQPTPPGGGNHSLGRYLINKV